MIKSWDSVEKAMAPHSNTLAWKIPWTEEACRLQSMGLRRVRHDWATSLSLSTFMHWRRKWQPTPVFLPWRIPGTGEPGGLLSMGSHSRTQLKWLSSSSSSMRQWLEKHPLLFSLVNSLIPVSAIDSLLPIFIRRPPGVLKGSVSPY